MIETIDNKNSKTNWIGETIKLLQLQSIKFKT